MLTTNQLVISFADVRTNIMTGIKMTRIICQRDLIEKYIKSGGFTTEIKNRARINLGAHKADKNPKSWKKEIRRLWGLRLTSKNRDLREIRTKWIKDSQRLKRNVNNEVWKTILNIRSEEMDRVWRIEKQMEQRLPKSEED